jgi:hypothetical protein
LKPQSSQILFMVDVSLGDRDLARVMAYLTLERLIFVSIILIIGL